MMAEPIVPGRGLPVNQPATVVLDDTWSVPSRLTPRWISLVRIASDGMLSQVGRAACAGPARSRSTFFPDRSTRATVDRYLSSEVVYLGGGFDFDDEQTADVLQTRRRDWTPWEFERACRNLGHRLQAQVRRVESPLIPSHRADEQSAGLERGIVEFLTGAILAEMILVLGREEGALVMVKPPGQAWV